LIELTGVTKTYGSRVAVKDLNLAIPEGTLFSLVGPNGAGKTTTIKMLCGLLRPTTGAIRIFGHDMTADGNAAKALVSYIPDQPHIYEKLTGREFLEMVGRMYGMDQDRLRRRVGETMELLELGGFADDLVEQYSHGMKQRCVMAAALVHDPRLIVVDEPMVGLDPRNIRRIKTVFQDFVRKGNVVFMSTHSLGDVEEMSNSVGVIHNGALIAVGPVDEVKQKAHAARFEESFLTLTEGAAS